MTDDEHTDTRTAPSAKPRPAIDLSKRDLTVDFIRVFCVLLVVAIHLLEVGIGRDATGALSISRPLEQQSWFNGLTWGGQIMPLFFVVGGFASLTAWRSLQAKGGSAADFVRARVLRLALPALPLFLFYVVVIGGALLAGVPAAFLQTVTTGAGSPLWFLAAYTLVQAMVPTMTKLHLRAPKSTLVVLFAAAVLVDVARYSTGIVMIGLINLVFVWLFVQQLGFWYADGWFARRRWWQLVLIALVCYLSLEPLTTVLPYSPDMLTDLNPPTVPLMVLAIAQACVLRLLKPALTRLMRTRGAQGLVFTAGTRLMTIYLWHLPLIIALSGLTLLIPEAAPEPASAAWWLTRIPFYLLVLACLYALSFAVGRFERPKIVGPAPSNVVVGIAAALTFIPAFLILQWFLRIEFAVLGAVFLGIAVFLLSRRSRSSAVLDDSPRGERSANFPA